MLHCFKVLLIILITLSINQLKAQNIHYPLIAKFGYKLNDFIPAGWNIMAIDTGNLNQDNKKDIVCIIEKEDSVKKIKFFNKEKCTFFVKPRILFILFATNSKNKFIKALQNNTIIPDNDLEPIFNLDIGLYIKKKVLVIDIESWGTSTCLDLYKFKFINNDFKFIGEEDINIHRSDGDIEEHEYYYISQKERFSTGNVSRDKNDKTIWKKLKHSPIQSLKNMKEIY